MSTNSQPITDSQLSEALKVVRESERDIAQGKIIRRNLRDFLSTDDCPVYNQ